jgi:hypothetical protein
MQQIFPFEFIEKTRYTWLPLVKVKSQVIYIVLLLFIIGVLIVLPFIKLGVSVVGSGIIRPRGEKSGKHSANAY